MRRKNGARQRKFHGGADWRGATPAKGKAPWAGRTLTWTGQQAGLAPRRFHQRDACGNRAPGGGSGHVDGTLLRTFATCAAVTGAPVLPQLVRTKFDTSATS